MTRFLGLLLVTATLSLGSCQCSNKPDIGPVEEDASAGLIGSDVSDTDENDTIRSVDAVPAAVTPMSS